MIDQDDISCGKEDVPIPVENNDSEVPQPFEYVLSSIPSPNCSLEDFEVQYAGCSCFNLCASGKCACIQSKSRGATYDSSGHLLPQIWASSVLKPVFECNSQCTCKIDQCQNRVVQLGIKCQLRVIKTVDKGWALRTVEGIAKGIFVCEYAGEVLTYTEARDRTIAQKEVGDNYIHVLKEHLGCEQVIQTIVDPRFVGNVGRFINHSCDPNLVMIPVRVENAVPKLALFANRHIVSGKELCFNYSGGDVYPVATEQVGNAKPCFCKSDICNGFLPFDHTLFPV